MARCLQLGQGVERSDEKAKEYFDKVECVLLSIIPYCIVCRRHNMTRISHQIYIQR